MTDIDEILNNNYTKIQSCIRRYLLMKKYKDIKHALDHFNSFKNYYLKGHNYKKEIEDLNTDCDTDELFVFYLFSGGHLKNNVSMETSSLFYTNKDERRFHVKKELIIMNYFKDIIVKTYEVSLSIIEQYGLNIISLFPIKTRNDVMFIEHMIKYIENDEPFPLPADLIIPSFTLYNMLCRQIEKKKIILIQSLIRGYLLRKYIKHYTDFIDYIIKAKEIIKDEQELKDLVKKYEEKVNKENQEKFNKIFLQKLLAPQKTPWQPEKDLLDSLNTKPTTPVNPSPNNLKPPTSVNPSPNNTDVKLIGGLAAGTLGLVVATKIGAIGIGVALSPFTGGASLTLSYVF